MTSSHPSNSSGSDFTPHAAIDTAAAPTTRTNPASNAAPGPTLPPSSSQHRGDESRQVLRCESTADFLAVLPFVTGFTDDNSLFVVLFRGRRSEDVLRIDLPRDGDREGERALCGMLIELLRLTDGGQHSPALVLMTSQSFAGSRGVPYLRLARTIERRCAREGWRLRELAVVAADGWAGLLGAAAPKQRSLDEISGSDLASRASAAAHTAPLVDIGSLPTTDERRRQLVAHRLAELEQVKRRKAPAPAAHAASNAGTDDPPTWLLGVSRAAEACFEAHREGDLPDPRLLARLIVATREPTQWCAVVLTALTSSRFVADIAADHHALLFERLQVRDAPTVLAADEVPQPTAVASLEGVLHALSEVTPDGDRLSGIIAALADAASHAPDSDTPGVLAMLAWAWWMRGMQSVAHRLLQRGLGVAPGHEISQLIEQIARTIPEARLQALRAWRDGGGDAAPPITLTAGDAPEIPQPSLPALPDHATRVPLARAG
ncbi:MAG: DUF4192 family protein [Microbacteriaceae bacterium]|nr:DUF4192 family protein [Microbacteriaceae bacterium]